MKKVLIIAMLFLSLIKVEAQCEQYGSIVISEVYFDSRYNENINTKYHHFGEYIELFNSSNVAIDLHGWKLKDNQTQFTILANEVNPNTVIEPGGTKVITFSGFYAYGFVLTQGGAPVETGAESAIGARNKFVELFPQVVSNESDIILQNRIVLYNLVDKISLYNEQGRLIDEIVYKNLGHPEKTDQEMFEYLNVSSFTIDLSNEWLSNEGGGTFNGPIGGFAIYDSGGEIIGYTESGLWHKGLFRSNPNHYYYGDEKDIEVTDVTPLTVPFSIPLKDPHPNLFLPDFDKNHHYIHSIDYDLASNVKLSESRTYFDDLAQPVVSLSHDFRTSKTWGVENTYDNFGRPFQSSFPALICEYDFSKTAFLSNPNYFQWLTKYYSDQNTEHLYQSTATQPFTQIEYDQLNPGNVIKQFGGNQINGEWKSGFTYTMPATQEMHYVYGYDYFDAPIVETNKKEINTKFYKTISVDPHGVESVVFSDEEGKVLATARSGTGITNYPVVSVIGTQGHVDVHIPSGMTQAVTFLGGRSLYDVWNLKTGQLLDAAATLAAGNFYRVVAKVTPTSDPKVYVTMVSNGAITTNPTNALGISYWVNYYDYSINVYNKTGQLTRVVQPLGFKNALVSNSLQTAATRAYMSPTATSFVSNYLYNGLGQLIESTSPDEGTNRFIYRKDGQLRYSQNALQRVSNKFSYTDYDSYGRPRESGVVQWDGLAVVNPDGDLLTGAKMERSYVIYDYPTNHNFGIIPTLAGTGLNMTQYNQQELAGNVVMTFNEHSATWYSYDIYGRVQWMVQSIVDLPVKTIHYTYDSKGQVKQVIYQKDLASEKFIHQYSYNLNGALQKVETSTDGTNFTLQADYSYYVDGALKRKNINNGLQGLDYVYTLGGMLKSINHPSLLASKDPGGDSNDVFGIILDYYSGDYNRPSKPNINSSDNVGLYNTDMYDGNIKAVRWAQKSLDLNASFPNVSTTQPKAFVFKYNANGWLADTYYGAINPGTLGQPNNSMKSITVNNNYGERVITYDANGNIAKLQRTNENGLTYDNFSYNYNATNNQLNFITDNPTASVNYDIDTQSPGNYTYDLRGQLERNNIENLRYFYNTQGLVYQVDKNGKPVVKFFYNERGDRIKKESFATAAPNLLQRTDYYVNDSSGNVLSIYTKFVGQSIQLKELPIFGDTMLGVYMKDDNSTNYQITDHLGNVRAVIKRQGSTPQIIQYADYYPFGEQLPLRNSLSNYRYAFQGQEFDTETGMEAFELRLWDGRIGRWLNPDPYGQFHSPYLGMGNNPFNGIDSDGGFWEELGNWLSGNAWKKDRELYLSIAKGNEVGYIDGLKVGYNEVNNKIRNGYNEFLAHPGDYIGEGIVNTLNGTAQFVGDTGLAFFGIENKTYRGLANALYSIPDMTGYDFGRATFPTTVIVGTGYLTGKVKIPVIAPPAAKTSLVQANRTAGNLFRDELAAALEAEGRTVYKEVYKWTPFGKRYMDIDVWDNGVNLGGIETKVGGSRYKTLQRLKDAWLGAQNIPYPVQLVRKPSDW